MAKVTTVQTSVQAGGKGPESAASENQASKIKMTSGKKDGQKDLQTWRAMIHPSTEDTPDLCKVWVALKGTPRALGHMERHTEGHRKHSLPCLPRASKQT